MATKIPQKKIYGSIMSMVPYCPVSWASHQQSFRFPTENFDVLSCYIYFKSFKFLVRPTLIYSTLSRRNLRIPFTAVQMSKSHQVLALRRFIGWQARCEI